MGGSNLAPRNCASTDDVSIFQRKKNNQKKWRIFLTQKSSNSGSKQSGSAVLGHQVGLLKHQKSSKIIKNPVFSHPRSWATRAPRRRSVPSWPPPQTAALAGSLKPRRRGSAEGSRVILRLKMCEFQGSS